MTLLLLLLLLWLRVEGGAQGKGGREGKGRWEGEGGEWGRGWSGEGGKNKQPLLTEQITVGNPAHPALTSGWEVLLYNILSCELGRKISGRGELYCSARFVQPQDNYCEFDGRLG